jgi:F-type H+-transporting ATPase subunit b
MTIDATFWVAISFFLFVGLLIYFKIPQKIGSTLNQNINEIKKQIDGAEKLKEEAVNILNNSEKKLSNSKNEIKAMIDKANEDSEKNILKTNKAFHSLMEVRKKNAEQKLKQMKDRALKEIKNESIKIAISSVEKLLKNSIDKTKLDKIYLSSIEETKVILKNRSS